MIHAHFLIDCNQLTIYLHIFLTSLATPDSSASVNGLYMKVNIEAKIYINCLLYV
jgi:hypothetical protein